MAQNTGGKGDSAEGLNTSGEMSGGCRVLGSSMVFFGALGFPRGTSASVEANEPPDSIILYVGYACKALLKASLGTTSFSEAELMSTVGELSSGEG